MKLSIRALIFLAVALLSLPLAACGQEETVTVGETEGTYLDLGGLQYQVQISRVLNPADPEDKAYLVDVPVAEQDIAADEAWFAVFLLAQNNEERPNVAASEFELHDTQENVYRPIPLGDQNVWAYRGGVTLAPGDQIPTPDSPSFNSPSVGGDLLLFRVKNPSFDNRPLAFILHGPDGGEAEVDLDV